MLRNIYVIPEWRKSLGWRFLEQAGEEFPEMKNVILTVEWTFRQRHQLLIKHNWIQTYWYKTQLEMPDQTARLQQIEDELTYVQTSLMRDWTVLSSHVLDKLAERYYLCEGEGIAFKSYANVLLCELVESREKGVIDGEGLRLQKI